MINFVKNCFLVENLKRQRIADRLADKSIILALSCVFCSTSFWTASTSRLFISDFETEGRQQL